MSLAGAIGQVPGGVPFHTLLQNENGKKAFYDQPGYGERTLADFKAKRTPVTFICNTEFRIVRFVKQILSIIIFPIYLYKMAHSLVGRRILPIFDVTKKNDDPLPTAQNIEDENEKFKPITVEVDGVEIDGLITGTPATLNNGRWILMSSNDNNGNKYPICSYEFQSSLSANMLTFNFPDIKNSSGRISRQAMVKAYQAMLKFLESDNGIKAKEIIGFGHSYGAAIQAEALSTHKLRDGIKYVFVTSRAFSSLTKVPAILKSRINSLLVKLFGWNVDVTKFTANLKAPEVTVDPFDNNDKILSTRESRYGQVQPPRPDTYRVCVADGHNTFNDVQFITQQVGKYLGISWTTSAEKKAINSA